MHARCQQLHCYFNIYWLSEVVPGQKPNAKLSTGDLNSDPVTNYVIVCQIYRVAPSFNFNCNSLIAVLSGS